MRKFNVTGLCIPEKHYMVDISNKVNKIVSMVEEGLYFTINRPRQFGKTTMMFALSKVLSDKYLVIKTSFEGIGDDIFDTEEAFCKEVFNIFARSVRFTDKFLYETLKSYAKITNNFSQLSNSITDLIESCGKDIILIIDEVDKSSGNRIFMQFLGVLRNKYLAQASGEDLTFKSVILGGVNDIKNLKLKIREERDRVFNSPWNVAAKFNVDMSFNVEEIKTMLLDYQRENILSLNLDSLADEIYKFTNGYPFLVSNLCLIIEDELSRDWSIQGIENAVKLMLKEKNTLFDDLIKNIENNPDLKSVITTLLVRVRSLSYNPDVYELGLMYGIFTEYNNKLAINNKIFEERIYNYLVEGATIQQMSDRFINLDDDIFIQDNKLNMEKLLLKFQEFMYEQYRVESHEPKCWISWTIG